MPARAARADGDQPNILIVAVDTLRADRLSAYGYGRPTSPAIDRLLAAGARFTQARTVEGLTGPAMCSMVTTLDPHQHGASRNGLRMRPRIASFPKLLRRAGYRTAAFVGNWTLKDKNTGLAEHFETYEEVFTRKRWFFFSGEATGEDLTNRTIEWIGEHATEKGARPVLAWVHYVEPHAPYRLWEEHAPRLGVRTGGTVSKSDRYDTEVAFVDSEIERLLAGIEELDLTRETLVVFVSDHGESLGEHAYWGHGRHTYEPSLHIPLGFTWPGRIPPGVVVDAPAVIRDVGPTLLGLLGLPKTDLLAGHDWSGTLVTGESAPDGRITRHQAHKGAVLGGSEGERSRVAGLLEVAILADGRKEILRVGNGALRIFDLDDDPRELKNLAAPDEQPSEELRAWLAEVEEGLRKSGDLPVGELDDEAAERLKALGYVDG